MASEVQLYDISSLTSSPNISFNDWAAMGVKTGMAVATFVQNEKNRKAIRKNINNAILTLDEQIKSETKNLNKQLLFSSTQAKYKIQQAVANYEAKKKKLFAMLSYIDSKRTLLDYEKISTIMGIVVIVASILYIGIKIITKGDKYEQ